MVQGQVQGASKKDRGVRGQVRATSKKGWGVHGGPERGIEPGPRRWGGEGKLAFVMSSRDPWDLSATEEKMKKAALLQMKGFHLPKASQSLWLLPPNWWDDRLPHLMAERTPLGDNQPQTWAASGSLWLIRGATWQLGSDLIGQLVTINHH